MTLFVQQVGNALVATNLIATKLTDDQQPIFIGTTILAFALTMTQLLIVLLQKASESEMAKNLMRLRR